jgi:hypothetical protein
MGANVGAPGRTTSHAKRTRAGQAGGDHASLRTDPDDAERLTGHSWIHTVGVNRCAGPDVK